MLRATPWRTRFREQVVWDHRRSLKDLTVLVTAQNGASGRLSEAAFWQDRGIRASSGNHGSGVACYGGNRPGSRGALGGVIMRQLGVAQGERARRTDRRRC